MCVVGSHSARTTVVGVEDDDVGEAGVGGRGEGVADVGVCEGSPPRPCTSSITLPASGRLTLTWD